MGDRYLRVFGFPVCLSKLAESHWHWFYIGFTQNRMSGDIITGVIAVDVTSALLQHAAAMQCPAWRRRLTVNIMHKPASFPRAALQRQAARSGASRRRGADNGAVPSRLRPPASTMVHSLCTNSCRPKRITTLCCQAQTQTQHRTVQPQAQTHPHTVHPAAARAAAPAAGVTAARRAGRRPRATRT